MKLFLLTNLVFLVLFSCSTTEKKETRSRMGSDRHELSDYYDENDYSENRGEDRSDSYDEFSDYSDW